MKNTIAVFSTLGTLLALSGCATHSHVLRADSRGVLARGEFVHSGDTRLTLETASRRYEAVGFPVRRHQNLAELRKQYRGSDPRHWDRIFAGHDKDHESYSADVVATASDGSRIACSLAWPSGEAPAGDCVGPNESRITIRFE